MVRRAGILVGLVSIAAVMSSAPSASAQETEPTPPAVRAAEAASDTVHLRNGGLYRGRIVEIVPGDHLTLIVEGGESKQVPWADVDRIVAAGSPSQPALVIPANPSAPSVALPPAPAPQPLAPGTPAGLDAPPSDVAPRPQWRHNKTLVWTGTLVFAAGYAPVAAVALPSTAGLAGRVVLIFLTLGLACLDGGSGYLCGGEHGAMQLLIPVAGPILFAGSHPQDYFVNENGRELSGLTKGLLYASAGVQAAGLVTLVSGIVFGRYERVDERPAVKSGSAAPSFFVRPLGAPGALGLSVGAYRW